MIPWKTAKIVTGLFLGAVLWTYTLPLIQVKVPPIVHERWGAWSITKSLPKMMTKRESKMDAVKIDFDFLDVLVKILPKNENTGARSKISLTFVLGILIPLAMLLAYGLAVIGIFLVVFNLRRTFITVAAMGSGAAAYTLIGTYYLGLAAQGAAQAAVDARAKGFLGVVTKHMVREISITPDLALYGLFGFMVAAFLTTSLSKK